MKMSRLILERYDTTSQTPTPSLSLNCRQSAKIETVKNCLVLFHFFFCRASTFSSKEFT